MADRPILFSAPMVRALLAGTKTQTRRTLKPQPVTAVTGFQTVFSDHPYFEATVNGAPLVAAFPAGHGLLSAYPPLRYAIGDRLWVRETWTAKMVHGWTIADARSGRYQTQLVYRADGADSIDGWWPAIHMPREFSRITLTVTDVRVQRLQDISTGDAEAEGALVPPYSSEFAAVHAVPMYQAIWEGINGLGSWDANPWVAAYTFSVALGNIDQVPA